jgi:YHS domain-containing protein
MLSLRKKTNRDHEPEELIQDPYCQTYIPKGSAVKKRINGKDYYFCNQECLRKYLEKS